MASPTVLTFHAEGRAVDFDVWVDDLQWDSRDGVSLFDHTSGVSTAPAASADSTVHSQWTTRDTVARLAVRSHLPPTERAHFGHRKVHWDAAKRVLRYLCSTSSMWLVLGGRGSVVLTRHSDASWADNQVTQRSSQGYNFSLGSGSVSWRSTRSSFVLGSSCEAEIYAGAMVAQELRWLTYLLTDLGERPRSPPVLSLLLESEETHFTQVRTASDFLTAIKARYATPTTVSLGRLFLPFLFPDLALFERTAESITNLRSLDSSYRAACTDAQLVLLPPPMAITLYFIATSLPDRLASVRDALLLKHPSELTIEVLESALKDVERNLRSVASASGVVPPPLFHGCTVPQLPTFPAVRD
ncbi:unnamed protein product [Closterium sp. NIES-54]